jgi:hypothetical protein
VFARADVFICGNEVTVDSARATELLVKIELVGIAPLIEPELDGRELLLKTVLDGMELLAKTELVGRELLLITGTDVLKCAELVIELLVIGTKPAVLVELRRGVAVIIDEVAVLLMIGVAVGIELLLGGTLLEVIKTDDDGVITGLDVVSGVVVGVQDVADNETVTVLSYTEVTSLEKV